MTIAFLLILAGICMLAIAIIGGGLKAKDVEVPHLSSASRALCATASIALIILGLTIGGQTSPAPTLVDDSGKTRDPKNDPVAKLPPNVSTTCHYTSGPKEGKTHYFPPNLPGLVPAFVGSSCMDGQGNFGIAVPDGTQADD
jgi:hypothetical protein